MGGAFSLNGGGITEECFQPRGTECTGGSLLPQKEKKPGGKLFCSYITDTGVFLFFLAFLGFLLLFFGFKAFRLLPHGHR